MHRCAALTVIEIAQAYSISAEMSTDSTQLDALPVEMVAHVALFLDRHTQRTSVRTRDESLVPR